MKRLPLIIIIFTLLLSVFPLNQASAASKDDISGHYFETDMRILIGKGLLGGYGNGIYKPDNPVTRAEFASFIVRALDLGTMAASEFSVAQVSESASFTDINTDDWYYPAILAASQNRIVGGYPDGSFQPNTKISRQEMAAMIMRAIQSKGVISEAAPLNFTDQANINPMFRDAVQRLLFLGVMSGKADASGNIAFAPLNSTTRGETSAVINRMLKVIHPPQNLDYKVASITKGSEPIIVNEYETFTEAKNKARDNQVVMHGNVIVWMTSGIAVSNKFTVLYTDATFKANSTYVASGVELKYYDATEDWVKVQIADVTGYVKPDTVNLTPTQVVDNRSFYETNGGTLVHKIYNPILNSWASYTFGKAPSFMKSGAKYYSWNGNSFYLSDGSFAGDAYQYFNRMPLYTQTQYTGAQLDEFIRSVKPNSPLIGTGDAFKKAEQQYGTNALYFLAHAILESNWGESKIAKDKNNLFGLGAVDSSPYESAYTFGSYEAGILDAANKYIVPGYFSESDWRFSGEHLGNKSTGMNVRYASDPYWGQKISGLMFQIDQYLSSQYNLPAELNKYKLAETIVKNVNVRSGTQVTDPIEYKIRDIGTTIQVLDTLSATGTWYVIAPKNIMGQTYPELFAYSHGYESYGTSLKLLPLAE